MLPKRHRVRPDTLRVFVSSRMEELAEERRVVGAALDGMFEPWVFESDAGAGPGSPRQTYLEELALSDVYVGIFWKSLGAFTRDEFEAAQRWEIPPLVYEKEADPSQRDPQLQAFLDEVGDVERGVTIRRFHEAPELESLVANDVESVQSRLRRVHGSNGRMYTGTRFGGRYDATASQTPLRRDPRVTTTCSSPPDPFVGRREEVDRARSAVLASEAMVGFRGVPGIGKTATLRVLARDPAWTTDRFQDGVGLCLDGSQARHVGDLLRSIWSEFYRVDDYRYAPDDRELRRGLAGKRALVLIDDVGLPADQVSRLRDAMPRGVLVLTAADSEGPDPLDLGPLAYAKAVPLAGLDEPDEMLALFEAVYGTAIPDAIEHGVVALCRRVDGSPGRITMLANDAWGKGGDLARWVETKVEATLEPVAQMLEDEHDDRRRRALMLFGAFGSAVSTPAAVARELGVGGSELAAVTTSGAVDEDEHGFRLRSATYAGVLGMGRPEQLRAEVFSAAVAVANGSPRGVGDRDQAFYLRVMEWGAEHGRHQGVLDLARAMDETLALTAWGSWDRSLERAHAAASALGDDSARAWALHEMGTRALMLGEAGRARRHLKASRRLRKRIGEWDAAAVTGHNLGFAPLLPIPLPAAQVLLGLLAVVAVAVVLTTLVPSGSTALRFGDVPVGDTAILPYELDNTSERPREQRVSIRGDGAFCAAAEGEIVCGDSRRDASPVPGGSSAQRIVAPGPTFLAAGVPQALAPNEITECRVGGREGRTIIVVVPPQSRCALSVSFAPALEVDEQSRDFEGTLLVDGVDETIEVGLSGRGIRLEAAPTSTTMSPDTTVSDPTAGNQAPVARDLTVTVAEGGSEQVALLFDDTDADHGVEDLTVVAASEPGAGTIEVANGGVLYSHDGSETREDSFTYRLSDGLAESGDAQVTVIVEPVNDAPTLVDVLATVDEGGRVFVDVLAGAQDPDHALEDLVLVEVSEAAAGRIEIVDGEVVYIHDGSETIEDSFTYRLSDGSAESNDAVVRVAVSPVNDPPRAADVGVLVDEGAAVVVGLRSGAADEDHDIVELMVHAVAQPGSGTVEVGDGEVLYIHDGSTSPASLLQDSFVYQLDDGVSQSNEAVVTVTVNRRPTATDTTINIACLKSETVLLGGSDPDGDALEVSIAGRPSEGTLNQFVWLGDTEISAVYSPGESFSSDQFSFEVSDGRLNDTGTVEVVDVGCIDID